MASKEPQLRVFTETSSKTYDRHEYVLVLKNGKSIRLPDYETAKNMWWNMCAMGGCSHIEVVDPVKKKTSGGGF